jgi:pimeloyl-ACP methyl ester carboxylesterase
MSAGAVIAGPHDAPPALLIHGLGGSHRVWDRVLPMIQAAARVYAVELSATRSIDDDADAITKLIREPMLVVGHSRGALIATSIAERHPDRVQRLILLSPPWSMQSRRSASNPAERALAIPGLGSLLWALASTPRQRAAMRGAFGPATSVPDQFLADLRARGRRNFVDSSRAVSSYLHSCPLPERLASISTAVDLVFGELDARIASPGAEFAALPGATVTILPGVGHTPPWEAPEAVADLILRSLKDASAQTLDVG